MVALPPLHTVIIPADTTHRKLSAYGAPTYPIYRGSTRCHNSRRALEGPVGEAVRAVMASI